MRRIAAILMLGLIPPLSMACGDEGAPLEPQEPGGRTVSFTAEVQPVFDGKCVGCHGSGGNGNLDLRAPQSHGNLVGVRASGYVAIRVVPADPDSSLLYVKLSGAGRYGDRMPLGGPYLGAEQLETIRAWIAGGAHSD